MKPSEIKDKIHREELAREAIEDSKLCPDCKGTGIIAHKFIGTRPCIKCILKGKYDQQ